MAGKSAKEVFTSPEGKGAATGAVIGGVVAGSLTGGLGAPAGAAVGGAIGAAVGGAASQGKKAAEEDQAAAAEAFKKAQGLQTTVETAGTNAVKGTSTQTSGTTFAPASKAEQELRDASIANFQRQQALVGEAESGIGARQGVQAGARGTLGGILGGQAFDLTPSEQARIDALRGADISASSNAVNELLTQRLGDLSAEAARRGIRGQAFSQLQGDVLGEAAKSLERSTLEANRTAAGQALAMPGQRAGIQASTAGQFADFADIARQQAIANRASLQDPVALQQMLDERLRGGTQTSMQTTDQTTTSADKRIGTGEGAAGVLQAGVGLPSGTAGGLAGGLGAIGALGQAAGGAGTLIGAVK